MSGRGPIPFNEDHRLAALRSLDVLDSPEEPGFDALTRLAARHFGVPIALVSLVDRDRQWFKAKTGLAACETPRESAFCAHTIMEADTHVVLDAAADPRFADNPLVTGAPNIRFYAGAPLTTEAGFKLGTLCIIDQAPREAFSNEDRATLRDFAAAVMALLEARRSSATDPSRPTNVSAVEDVVSHLAHEIRAPLSAIVNYADLIRLQVFGPTCGEAYREQGERIATVGRYLCDMAQRTLESARLKSGEVVLEESWLPVSGLEERVGNLLPQDPDRQDPDRQDPDRQDRRVTWRSTESSHLLHADEVHLLQMLINLLGNALKYSAGDSRIEVLARVTDEGALDLIVADDGPGMTRAETELALLPFGRAASATQVRDDSFGLGLPLTKRLVELHGGRLLVDSAPGKGTAVTLRFPPYRVSQTKERAQASA